MNSSAALTAFLPLPAKGVLECAVGARVVCYNSTFPPFFLKSKTAESLLVRRAFFYKFPKMRPRVNNVSLSSSDVRVARTTSLPVSYI